MMPDISQEGGVAWLWAPCYKSESCFSCWVRMAMWSFWCFPTRMCSTTWSCEFALERDYSLASPTPIFVPKAMWHHVKPCGTMSSHVKHMEPPIYWSCNQVLLTLWSRSITDDLLPLQGNLTLAYHTHAHAYTGVCPHAGFSLQITLQFTFWSVWSQYIWKVKPKTAVSPVQQTIVPSKYSC